jgi:hypothetical protein
LGFGAPLRSRNPKSPHCLGDPPVGYLTRQCSLHQPAPSFSDILLAAVESELIAEALVEMSQGKQLFGGLVVGLPVVDA